MGATMKARKSEPEAKPRAPKPRPKLGRDVATFAGPIVYRVSVDEAEAVTLQAAGFRKIQAGGGAFVMGADSLTLAKYRGGK
jgi:hypothetical protein